MLKNISIIYLDRNQFNCISPHQIDPIQYHYPPQVVKDFEVLNKDLLYSEMHTFITNNRISSYPIIVILSNNVIFEKDLFHTKPDQLSEEIVSFLDKVPFETIIHKIIKVNKETKIIATNKIYLDLMKDAFEKDQCKILLVLPESLFDGLISQKGLDTTVVKKIIGSFDSLKQYDLLHIPHTYTIPQSDEATFIIPEKKTPRTWLIILLIFFILLVSILILLILMSQRQSSKSTIPQVPVKQIKVTPSPISSPIPQVTPFVEISPSLEESTSSAESLSTPSVNF